MSIDVCILAGGHGTRLAGVWDKAKCLVPLGPAQTPLLKLLLDDVLALQPRTVFLLLGSDLRAEGVIQFLKATFRKELVNHTIMPRLAHPTGTASALRDVAPWLSAPVLVLNGDTLPLYRLSDFVRSTVPLPISAWHDGLYAGASLLDDAALNALWDGKFTDFSGLLPFLRCVEMDKGFHDIGTPESFAAARFIIP